MLHLVGFLLTLNYDAQNHELKKRGLIYFFFNLGASCGGMGVQRQAPAALPSGKRPGFYFIGGWVGPRAGLDGCGIPRLHRDSTPGPSICSESLYRLRYPGPPHLVYVALIC